jgi:hypothetical protein
MFNDVLPRRENATALTTHAQHGATLVALTGNSHY